MNPWIWLGISLILVVVAFGIAYRFAPQGWRTLISNRLMALATTASAAFAYLADVDWTAFGFSPAAIAVIPVVVNAINDYLRKITKTPVRQGTE